MTTVWSSSVGFSEVYSIFRAAPNRLSCPPLERPAWIPHGVIRGWKRSEFQFAIKALVLKQLQIGIGSQHRGERLRANPASEQERWTTRTTTITSQLRWWWAPRHNLTSKLWKSPMQRFKPRWCWRVGPGRTQWFHQNKLYKPSAAFGIRYE